MLQAPPIDLAAFLHLTETKPASEFIDGQVIQKPMPQGEHSRLQQKLITAINAVTEDDRQALALPELRCTFGDKSLVPDIAVFEWGRIPISPAGGIANRFAIAPDWAIEILSPDQSSTRVTANLVHCLEHGTQLGWLIDPAEQLVLVYPPGQQVLVISQAAVLPVPEFATGLRLSVEQVFGWLKLSL
jgi:Uma2 family endonuclease